LDAHHHCGYITQLKNKNPDGFPSFSPEDKDKKVQHLSSAADSEKRGFFVRKSNVVEKMIAS
jgi:hypothetical protein